MTGSYLPIDVADGIFFVLADMAEKKNRKSYTHKNILKECIM